MPDLSPLPHLERPHIRMDTERFEVALRAGSSRASRAAALTSAVAAAVVAAVLLVPGGSGPSSLAPADVTEPARQTGAVADPRLAERDDHDGQPGNAPAGEAPAPAPAPDAAPAPRLRVVARSDEARSTARDATRPRPPATDAFRPAFLEFAADGTAMTHIDLSSPVRLALSRPDVVSSGRYAGLYLAADDGSTYVAVMSLLRAAAAPATDWELPYMWMGDESHSSDTAEGLRLPAGRYRVYVVGEGRVRIRVGLTAGTGLSAVATAPATARFRETVESFEAASRSQTARLRLDTSPSAIGVAGAWLSAPGAKVRDKLKSCVVERSQQCGDDSSTHTSTELSVQDNQWGYSMFPLERHMFAAPHDVVAEGTVAAATDARIYVWSIVLDL